MWYMLKMKFSDKVKENMFFTFIVLFFILLVGISSFFIYGFLTNSNIWDTTLLIALVVLSMSIMTSFCMCGEFHPNKVQGVLIFTCFIIIVLLFLFGNSEVFNFTSNSVIVSYNNTSGVVIG